eukprot:8311460-Lingulodinium_polyedra.AAC.1
MKDFGHCLECHRGNCNVKPWRPTGKLMPYCPRCKDRGVQSLDNWTAWDWRMHTEQQSTSRS